MRSAALAAVSFLFLVAALIVVGTIGIANVHPTEVAVEVDKVAGKISQLPLGVGYHFYNRWFKDLVIYHVAAQAYPRDTLGEGGHKQYTLPLKTNDGQNVNVDLTILYALASNEVPALHQQVGINYEDQVLLPQIRSEARMAIGRYSAEQIYQGQLRDEIQELLRTQLSEALSKYPAIRVQDALIREFDFSDAFENMIERKKLAAQEVEVNKNRALAQEEEAKRQEAEARGMKLKVIQEAEGRAQSAKIEADAERYKLEQEAAGKLALFKAEAEGKRLLTEAMGGGANVVAFEFARNLAPKLQVWGIPVGENNTSLMDVSGVFGKMFQNKKGE
jgi:regulator of protease activity HflC (stomatin/prohibitin superfamily)